VYIQINPIRHLERHAKLSSNKSLQRLLAFVRNITRNNVAAKSTLSQTARVGMYIHLTYAWQWASDGGGLLSFERRIWFLLA